MELQVIRAEQFPLGKPLPCNLYDRNGALLLKAGEVVNSHRQLEELCIDGLFIPKQDKADAPPEPPKQSPFVLLDALPGVVERLFGYMSVEPNFSGRTLAVAKTIQAACEIDREACVAWVFIGPDVRYVIAHPIHSAILCELVARQLGWSAEERLSLLSAALCMNIGKLVLQHKLSIQAKPLEPAQRVEMQAHCEQGVAVLQKLEVSDKAWLNAVAQHHERLDASGYPKQLASEAISREARLIAVADVYTALVTAQAHRPAQIANAAFKAIYAQRGKQLDSQMTDTLIKVMGVFPPGCYVKLANGEIAVVAHHGPTPTAPIVYSFINPRGQAVNVYAKRECAHAEFAIKEVLIKSKVVVTLNQKPKIWGYKA
ncbi:MAG: HD domain-containing phosphohydrolase [Burkholderiales bacterium]|nr:HD domain-containing phosphohydrolase [Burkholderiales bacterium]